MKRLFVLFAAIAGGLSSQELSGGNAAHVFFKTGASRHGIRRGI
jgi:hypothetical protein